MDRDERKEVDTLKQKVQEISEQQRMTRKIANVKYIAVEFDYKQYKNGEKEVNDAISHGYEVIDNYIKALESIFSIISECEKGKDIESMLDGPVCHDGFKRLN